MFKIDKRNRVTLTKGDTATMLVQVFDLDNKEYEILSTDTVTFTLRQNNSAKTMALQKEATHDHYIIIDSEDTKELPLGLYMYDVQLVTKEGFVYTIIPPSYFSLTSEVTI